MSRIASVVTHMISVPRPLPVWTAHEESKAWNVILTEIRTDDGLVGYGEIHGAPMPRICEWMSRFGEIIRGMDALAHVAVWEKLFALTSPRPGGIDGRDGLPAPVPRGARAQVMAAIAGIDIALWDIKGKAAGLPVYRLLRAKTGRFLLTQPAGTTAKCQQRRLRRRVGALPRPRLPRRQAEDRSRHRFARGGAHRRGVPGDRRRDAADARHERSLRSAGVHRFRSCRRAASDLLARGAAALVFAAGRFRPAGRGYADPARAWRARADPAFTVRDFIVEGGIRFVQFDATRAAGFTEALRIAALAEQHGAMVAPHTAPELLGHLVLALPRCAFGVESHGGPETDPLAFGPFREHPQLRDGHLIFANKPGFGLEIDWGFVDRHRVPQ